MYTNCMQPHMYSTCTSIIGLIIINLHTCGGYSPLHIHENYCTYSWSLCVRIKHFMLLHFPTFTSLCTPIISNALISTCMRNYSLAVSCTMQAHASKMNCNTDILFIFDTCSCVALYKMLHGYNYAHVYLLSAFHYGYVL